MAPPHHDPAPDSVDAVRTRLDELSGEHGIDDEARQQLERLVWIIAEDAHAPTAIRDPALAIDVHIADSLSALELPAVRAAQEVVDLGSGAGFPGLPVAVALPATRVRLVESSNRACQFLVRAIGEAGIARAEVVHRRAESWPDGAEGHDLALARALGPLPVVLEYAAPLLRVSGNVLVWRGARNADDERAGEAAARILGLEPAGVHRTRPFAAAREHHLHLYLKVETTPHRFPRRPGMATKRPLRR